VPTIAAPAHRGHGSRGARAPDKGEADEGQKLAPLAQGAPPRLPRGPAQGPGVCDQQDPAPLQGPPGLSSGV